MDRPPDAHGILDAIAAITSRRESGRLQITVSGSRGAFFFKNGKLVDARMGPFSGLPAVNHAISLGKADLRFDSSFQPPSSTFISIEEQVLLRERFGIETEGTTSETEGAALPVTTTHQVALSEEIISPQTHESEQDSMEGILINSGLTESRIRAARDGIAHREESQSALTANNFSLAKEGREAKKGIGNLEEELRESISYRMVPPATMSRQAGNDSSNSTYEQEKPEASLGRTSAAELSIIENPSVVERSAVTRTKLCPKCNRVYEEFRNYCRYDSTQLVGVSNSSFNDDVKPEGVPLNVLCWALFAISVAVGGILGNFLNNYLSRAPAAPTSIQAESEPNFEAEVLPVVEGNLRGKEISLVKPKYPAKAKSEGLSGEVTVAIHVNRQGRVISARALTGPLPLKVAAVEAARKSKFSPENLERQSSKNSGTITYTFK